METKAEVEGDLAIITQGRFGLVGVVGAWFWDTIRPRGLSLKPKLMKLVRGQWMRQCGPDPRSRSERGLIMTKQIQVPSGINLRFVWSSMNV